MKITKAILPVAGIGSRFLPATKSVPKELFPIADKPVIQYLVEEAVSAGIEEIIFVISREKDIIKDFFSDNENLNKTLELKGKIDILNKIKNIPSLAKFSYVYQDQALGDGHAVLMAKDLVGDDDAFLVLFGDDIVKNDISASKQMIDAFQGNNLFAAMEVDKDKTHLYGILGVEDINAKPMNVNKMVEKPKQGEAPSNIASIGKYICTKEIFKAIESSKKGKDGEMRLIDALIQLSEEGKQIQALKIIGDRFDTGNPYGLSDANVAFLKDL